ncbi:MAG: acyltransferase [Bacteroidetes bacterium]|nr:acyltransferase [Bacteroidota bacterium]
MFKRTQIPFINNLRGIAALLVCLYHFIYSTVNYVTEQIVLDIAYYGQFGITIFFVISGVVIPLSLLRAGYTIKKWPRFLMKRIIRIEPPYLVALALSVTLILLRKQIIKEDVTEISFTQVVVHIGYLVPFFLDKFKWLNEVFWTLAIEFQYYLLISFLILLVIKGKIMGRMLFYISLLGLPFYFLDMNFFPPYAAIFLMGICWSFYYVGKINIIEFLVVLFVSFFVVYFKFSQLDAFLALFAVIFIHFFNTYSNKILNFFGNISYSLYLIHPLIGGSIINVLSHSFFQSWQKPLVISLGLAVTILSSYIMYRFVEKPTQLLSKRIMY